MNLAPNKKSRKQNTSAYDSKRLFVYDTKKHIDKQCRAIARHKRQGYIVDKHKPLCIHCYLKEEYIK